MARKDPAAAAPAVTWICPMHPEVEQPAPGTCPKCHMKLEPKAKLNTPVS
jgi:P-type Cu+ transporter